ncbi:uncharacterized protein LDX57_001783 [Aspergillus melleus]|uniref:uncharacterized protein n=1 Tax=Aspergillus melleus TaxID=138277 RepID=UPI001E8E18AE|nr:uncharacterized protein LDX57_001783 [Aspergillus melleus]KAH8424028.1 hypothetical protein LDX57_001783 [Aspergillus melleus]
MKPLLSLIPIALNLITVPVQAQLSGSIGPKTSAADRASNRVCNVVDCGVEKGSSEDFAPALKEAWDDCADSGGGLIYIPPGI